MNSIQTTKMPAFWPRSESSKVTKLITRKRGRREDQEHRGSEMWIGVVDCNRAVDTRRLWRGITADVPRGAETRLERRPRKLWLDSRKTGRGYPLMTCWTRITIAPNGEGWLLKRQGMNDHAVWKLIICRCSRISLTDALTTKKDKNREYK